MSDETAVPEPLQIDLPTHAAGDDQDQEWCEVTVDGAKRRIRFHDYAEIFSIPGLYERLFYEELRCCSPRVVSEMLGEHLRESGEPAEQLRVLDVGAGNGIVGEEINALGAGTVIGVDIIEEAAAAAARDRPEVYDDYLVADLTDVPEEADAVLSAADFNCMTTVAALGYGDIPPEAFAGAFSYLGDEGLLGISIKSEFVEGAEEADRSGFAQLIGQALSDGAVESIGERRYVHRLSAAGEPIHYTALIGRKHGELREPEPAAG